MDEKEGPYVLVRNITSSSTAFTYSIAEKVKKQGPFPFYQLIVPNAGDGETARTLCNLLNKAYKEKTDEDEAAGDAGEGVDGQDLPHGSA